MANFTVTVWLIAMVLWLVLWMAKPFLRFDDGTELCWNVAPLASHGGVFCVQAVKR
jgi:hypothetical protein